MSAPLNPYIAGAPVTDERMFFGRQDIFEWIERSLAGLYADHILVLHGQRRVGKTSVLKQLPARLPRRYVPVFFDLQGRTHTSLDRFLWWLAREIARVLKQDRDILLPVPEKEAFAADPEYLEAHFLPAVKAQLGESNLLLTFDEFDTLEESGIRESLGRPLVDTLRRLMAHRNLNFIYSIGSSGRKLENMQAAYTEFFKAALYKKVSFLSAADARRLVTQPVEGVLEYDPPAVERILRLTRGHPYFTQLTCHELFSLCQRTGQRRVRAADVEQILDDVIERGTVNLKFVWDEASDLEKWALAGLASLEPGTQAAALAAFLHRQRVRFTDLELEAALVHLRERDVLTPDNGFVIELLRLWLARNRPIDQVREELVDVNPIASRYVEIGLEYRDAGQSDKAIASFAEALAVDADNLPAQVGLASVYLAQGALAQAAEAFGKALAIDADDVIARSGMCEAQLRLGDQALADDRAGEAHQAFHAILNLNPEHAEARQRMADLCQRQAQAALSIRNFESAVDLLRQALTYTPEDAGLEARLSTAQAEHRQARLQALSTQARAATTAERWAEAAAAWREYLTLSPTDLPAAQAELVRLEREAARAEAYATAQTALGRRDFDEGIRLLKAIVLEDETYKDAARLMTQAIEARRRARPAPRWPRLRLSRGARLALAAGLAVVTLGAVVFLIRDRFLGTAIPPEATAIAPVAAPQFKACLLAGAGGITGTDDAAVWRAIDAARSTYPITGTYAPGTTELNAARRIDDLVSEGCNLIVAFFPFAEAMEAAAAENPELSFLVFDTALGTDLPNLVGIQFKTWEPAFLAGYLAAGVSATGRVGTIGSTDISAVTLSMDAFARGVAHYNQVHAAEVVVLGRNPTFGTGLFLDSFEDIDFAINKALLDQGADVLFPVVGSATTAFAEAAQGRQRAYVIGTDMDWAEKHPEYANVILSSTVKDIEALMTDAIRRLVEGEFPGDLRAGNLENGGVGLAPFHELDSEVPAELVAELEALQQALPAQADPHWRGHSFPYGHITAIARVHSNPDLLYLGTEHAGIYRSEDGGQTWQPARNGLGGGAITSLAIHEADPNLLFASVGLAGVYRSTDGGHSWQPVNQGIDLDRLIGWGSTVVPDPYRYPVLWFADGSSVYQSIDLGETWIQHEPQDFQFPNLAADPSAMDSLYATSSFESGGEGAGVYASRDGGRTWTKLLELEAEYINPGQFAVDLIEGLRLYVSSESDAEGTYVSADGGLTWQKVLDYRCDHLAADRREAATAYCARGGMVLRTSNSGETWDNITDGELPAPISVLVIREDGYYAGTWGGLFVSTDLGLSWAERSSGLPLKPLDLSMVSRPGPRLYATDLGAGVSRSDVNGGDWQMVSAKNHTSWVLRADGAIAYATDGQRLWQSLDVGATWDERSAPSVGVGRLSVHPRIDGWVYSLYGEGPSASLFLSTDGGETWELTTNLNNIHDGRLIFDHGDGSRVYAVGHRQLYRSDTGGHDWQSCQWRGPPTSAADSGALVDPDNPDRLLVATQGGGVLISDDGCQTWNASNNGLENLFVHTLAVDPSHSDTFYAGTNVGAYLSRDDGRSWARLTGWFDSETMIFSLAVDPLNPGVLYAATPEGVARWELSPVPVPQAQAAAAPSWMVEFAEPILEAVSSRSPLFNYDFSTSSPPADTLFGDAAVAGGVLQCRVSNEGCSLVWHPGTADFAAEYEFTYMTPSSPAPVTLKFRAAADESLEFSLALLASPARGAQWSLTEASQPGDRVAEVGRGTTEKVSLGQRARVIVIAVGPRIAILLNGEPLVFYANSTVHGQGYELRLQSEVHFDNVRFWDLTELSLP